MPQTGGVVPGRKRSAAERARDEANAIMRRMDVIEKLGSRLEAERIEDLCDALESEVKRLRESLRKTGRQRAFAYRDEREAEPESEGSGETSESYRVT